MSVVDNIAKRNAEEEVSKVLAELQRDFEGADEGWLKSWGPRFRAALVGSGQKPEFNETQIRQAFNEVMQGWKYNSPPKPAHITEIARTLRPLPALQKAHTDPTPRRRWTAEERAANIARVEAITAKLDELELDPEYERIKREHGYGSPELEKIHARHREEFQRWVKQA